MSLCVSKRCVECSLWICMYVFLNVLLSPACCLFLLLHLCQKKWERKKKYIYINKNRGIMSYCICGHYMEMYIVLFAFGNISRSRSAVLYFYERTAFSLFLMVWNWKCNKMSFCEAMSGQKSRLTWTSWWSLIISYIYIYNRL